MHDENYGLSCVQGETAPSGIQNGHGSSGNFTNESLKALVYPRYYLHMNKMVYYLLIYLRWLRHEGKMT